VSLTIRGNAKNFDKPLSTDYRSSFLSFLADNGMEVDEKRGLLCDGSIGRAFINVGGQRKMSGWYQFWLEQSMPYGRIGDYRISVDRPTAIWKPENRQRHTLSQAERAEIALLQKKAEVKKAEGYTKAAKRSQGLWNRAKPVERHPYLEKKQVLSYGLREAPDGALMVPLWDADLQVVGLQYIQPDGSKRFLTGSKAGGSFFILGREILKTSDVIHYVEGYATAASLHAASSQPVVVCFSAGNLSAVSLTLHSFFADRKHVFVADNDESRTGEREAVSACQGIREKGGNAEVLMPETTGDYNDHATSGEAETLPALRAVSLPTEYEFSRSTTGRFLNSKDNIKGVLMTHGITVNYNVIKKRMEIEIPDSRFIADMAEESALVEIEDRCINMFIPHSKVRDYLKVLAEPYNPVVEWMDSVSWDGISRLQDFYDTITSSSPTRLKEMLMRKWLISCVAAAREPLGVELEGILVLQGAQGLGKTLWFKRLCDYSKGWLLEGATLNPSDKDSVKRAVSHWIVELGEIESTFKKADLDQLKSFITAKTDELRLPYDRAFTSYQRRTAFYASVNAREFLTDTSGNRRFWVISVAKINMNHTVNMQQLWAEVSDTLYIKGQKNWFLTPDERKLLDDSNEVYRTQSSVEDLILEHVVFDGHYKKPVQMTKLLRDLGIKSPRIPDFKDAARVLHANGVEPRRTNGRKVYDLDYTVIENSDNSRY